MYKLRRINGLAHVEDLVRLQKLTLPDDTIAPIKEGEWWLVTTPEQEAVAFANLKASQSVLGGGYLARAGVAPGHRGRGLQRKLIKARIARARKLGYTFLLTDTYFNAPSANNLIKCGFKSYDAPNPWGQKGAHYWRLAL